MKKLAIIFLSLFMAIGAFAQNKANTQSTTKIANDSTLIKIHDMLDDIDYRINGFDRFKLYATENIYNFLLLDTETGKTTLRDDQYKQEDDNDGEGFNGITVYLRDKNGNEIKRTTTSELGLYSEITGGESQFVDVDLDAIQKGEYYVEFEYCGLRYQSVAAKLTQNNGSKVS